MIRRCFGYGGYNHTQLFFKLPYQNKQGPAQCKDRFPDIGISVIKIRRLKERIIFYVGNMYARKTTYSYINGPNIFHVYGVFLLIKWGLVLWLSHCSAVCDIVLYWTVCAEYVWPPDMASVSWTISHNMYQICIAKPDNCHTKKTNSVSTVGPCYYGIRLYLLRKHCD